MKTIHFPIILIRNDNATWLFYSIDEIIDFCKKYKIRIQKYRYDNTVDNHPIINEWIARDDIGQIISSEEDLKRPYNYAFKTKRHDRYLSVLHASKLGLPIPGTSKRKYRGSYWRYPKHVSNMKRINSSSFDDEYGILFYSHERFHNIYDDILKSNYINSKSWKNYRKHQWKEKK